MDVALTPLVVPFVSLALVALVALVDGGNYAESFLIGKLRNRELANGVVQGAIGKVRKEVVCVVMEVVAMIGRYRR